VSTLVYSFDVFDTALVRTWINPTDLFWELGQQLAQKQLIAVTPDDWKRLRVASEEKARRISSTGEVTLEEIYSCIASSLNWSEQEISEAIASEISLEILSLQPVPEIQIKLQALFDAKERVIFISDMYLDSNTIEIVLKKNHLWVDGCSLYVSSEMKINKASGKLFQHCLDAQKINASQLIHTGDNQNSDVEVPRKLNIQAHSFTQAHLNRYEKLIAENLDLPLKFRSLIAGASRLTRLQSQEDTPDKKVIWDISASVIAPTLFGFVYWCLTQAQAEGIKRLYFVARDGQILLKVARVICQNWKIDIDCRYLYGSRQAWHFPALQELGEAEFNWIFEPTYFLSVYSVLERVNLKPQQLLDCLTKGGFPENIWNKNLDNDERARLRELFKKNEVIDLILLNASTYREKAIAYFKQEGMGDGVQFSIVDIGWNGRLQRSLSNLLVIAGLYPSRGTHGFYFGLRKRLKAFEVDTLLSYFIDPDLPSSERLDLCHGMVLELFTAADHGSTVRFDEYEGKFVPILRSARNEKALNWGLSVQQNSVVEFASQFTTNISYQECNVDLFLKTSEQLLRAFIRFPGYQESVVFGSYPVSEDQTESAFDELSPKYRLSDCLKLIAGRGHVHNNVWLPASINRSSSLPKIMLQGWSATFRMAIGLKRFMKKSLSNIYQTNQGK
jgi:predicted HAD superfamily hydrolase